MSKIISANKLGQVVNWTMPNVETGNSTIIDNDYSDGLAALGGQIPTAKDLENLQKKAYDESYKEGYSDGLRIAKDEQNNAIKALNNAFAQFGAIAEQIDTDIKLKFVELIIMIAKQIILKELSNDPDRIMLIVDDALKVLPVSEQNIYIHLNPSDAAIIKELIDKNQDKCIWEIVEDESITSGGCKVFTDNSSINATIENKLTEIAEKFLDSDQDVNENNLTILKLKNG